MAISSLSGAEGDDNPMNHDIINLYDMEARAAEALEEMVLGYYQSGAADEITLRENHAAYDRLQIHYRVLAGVDKRDLSTKVLDQSVSMPVLIAPTAFQKMAHPEGEAATARACKTHQTIMTLSTLSTTDMEEVVEAGGGAVWFQLYIYRDREATRALVQRAEAAGCRAIVLTVDAPLIGRRERDIRNQFHLPEGIVVRNMVAAGLADIHERKNESGLAGYVADQLDAGLTWDDVGWLQSITRLPVLIKGIVRPDDAIRAVQQGVAGIVVSNHGGRQLDTAPATIEVLPAIAQAVGGQCTLLVDGGIRRGTDILKAIALGANAVLVGRPTLWGLALGGQQGVEKMLTLLRDELDLAMALSGCKNVGEITTDLVHKRSDD